MSTIKGFAIIIVIAIIIIFFWCFVFGKCSSRGFGTIPSRPRITTGGRRRSDDDEGRDNADDDDGPGPITPATPKQVDDEEIEIDASGDFNFGDADSGKSKECGFWDIACKLGEAAKNITEGKTIFGQPRVAPGFERIAPTIRARQAIIIA